MKQIILLLTSLLLVQGSIVRAQHYATGYLTGYQNESYQAVRTYPLFVYHPKPLPLCLTCNDCGVPNQQILLPTAYTLHLEADRNPDFDILLNWELIISETFSELKLRWGTDTDAQMQVLTVFENCEIDSFLHIQPPARRIYYQLEAKKEDGTLLLSDIVEVQPIERQFDLVIYPNPGSDNIWLVVDEIAGSVTVAMQDIHGREVGRWDRKTSPSGQIEIQVPSMLSEGVYILELITERKRWQGRWIHQ